MATRSHSEIKQVAPTYFDPLMEKKDEAKKKTTQEGGEEAKHDGA